MPIHRHLCAFIPSCLGVLESDRWCLRPQTHQAPLRPETHIHTHTHAYPPPCSDKMFTPQTPGTKGQADLYPPHSAHSQPTAGSGFTAGSFAFVISEFELWAIALTLEIKWMWTVWYQNLQDCTCLWFWLSASLWRTGCYLLFTVDTHTRTHSFTGVLQGIWGNNKTFTVNIFCSECEQNCVLVG